MAAMALWEFLGIWAPRLELWQIIVATNARSYYKRLMQAVVPGSFVSMLLADAMLGCQKRS